MYRKNDKLKICVWTKKWFFCVANWIQRRQMSRSNFLKFFSAGFSFLRLPSVRWKSTNAQISKKLYNFRSKLKNMHTKPNVKRNKKQSVNWFAKELLEKNEYRAFGRKIRKLINKIKYKCFEFTSTYQTCNQVDTEIVGWIKKHFSFFNL